MRADLVGKRVTSLSHSKGAQRKRRLRRGIERWEFDRGLCAEPTRMIAKGTLTLADPDNKAAFGKVRDFWAKVRRTWLGTRYFCWLELTRTGRAHYHFVWLNPPHLGPRQLKSWVTRAWGGARTQVRFANARDGLRDEIEYAIGYAKKMGKKAYQQRYDEVPSELRTFMSQRLEIPPHEIDPCLELDEWRYSPQTVYRGELVEEYLEYVGTRVHLVPPAGRCRALDHRRERPGNGRHLRR